MSRAIAAAALMSISLATGPVQSAGAEVSYPDGYRAWYHVKSMVILPGHGLADPFQGIHHVYANPAALEGMLSGDYRDGSVLVFDLLHNVEGDNAIQEGQRKLIGVMERDGQRFAATGGWGFEGFAGNRRVEWLTNDGGQGCFECHAS